MGLFFGLNIALKGMMSQQTALSVASNNIANANTDGYSKQRTDMEDSISISGLVSGAQLGSGVDIADVVRVRNDFVDYQLRTQTSSLEYDTTMSDTLSNIETVFNETSDSNGLSTQLDKFWSAWQNVSTTPDSSAVRTTLMEAGVTLTDTLNQLSSQLTTIQNDTKTQIDQTIENVNNISQRVAKLNDQIVSSEVQGETPNSLLDARDLMLDKLSKIGNITITKCQNAAGNYTGAVSVQLGTKTIVDSSGASVSISSSDIDSSTVKDGSLAALVHLSGNEDSTDSVQYYIDKLNTLAAGIAKTVNDIHTTGTDLNGSSGEDFFVTSDSASNVTAANISINSVIQKNVSKIAASQGSTNLTGNGDIALQIADLKGTQLTEDLETTTGTGTITIGAFYSDMVTELGTQVSNASADVTNQQTVVDNLTTKKESASGVSVDEETANVVLYQHAYSACAKVISVIDEMLDTVINNMKS